MEKVGDVMAEIITFNGTDITEYVNAKKIVHDMYAGEYPDKIRIEFEDKDNLWPRWSPQVGDYFSYRNDGTATGKMYIYDLEYENQKCTLYGCVMPPEMKVRYTKTWESVYLSQILSEITEGYSHQLNAVTDVFYKHKECNTGKLEFLNTLGQLESAVLVIYDDNIMLVNEQALEAQTSLFELSCDGAEVSISDHTADVFDACFVQSGEYSGACRIGTGERYYKPNITVPCSSDAEATRYAKAMLRFANKKKFEIRWKGPIIPELSAGVCITLVNDDIPAYSGDMYVYHVRHDYNTGTSTIFMRKPLEGY